MSGITEDFPATEPDEADPHLSDAELAELFDDDVAPESRGSWCINTLSDLDWAMRRVADLSLMVDENKQVEQDNIDRIKSKTDALNAPLQRAIEFFTGRIREYAEAHRSELLKSGKAKSRKLLHGTVAWRKKGGGFKVLDEQALLDWCRAQPFEAGVLRLEESPIVDGIKKHIADTGEIPPGADIAEGQDVFEVKPKLIEGDDSGRDAD